MAITKVPKVMTTNLDQVDNTADIDKPISSATQDALDLKYDASNPDNFVDQTALDTKQDKILGGATGEVLTKSSNLDGAFTWSSPGTPTLPTTTKGDLIVHDGTTNVRLPVGGTNGQILAVNSATSTGVEWTSNIPSGYALKDVLQYTSSTSYTPSSGTRFLMVEIVGGGGGGGGAATTTAGQCSCAAGGNGGGFARYFVVNPTGPYTITIGAGGNGGAAGANGTAGGQSAFDTVTASGGNFGAASTASTGSRVVTPTSQAAGTGGALNIRGQLGMGGWSTPPAPLTQGGAGGASMYGQGGRNVVGTTGAIAGSAGVGFGGGGSGASNGTTGNAGVVGGDGSSGVVFIYEYA